MLVGTFFSTFSTHLNENINQQASVMAPEVTQGGGGYNPSIEKEKNDFSTEGEQVPGSEKDDYDKEDDNNGDQEEPSEPSQAEEITTYEYKSYDDYFIDLDIRKETITTDDLKGTGSESDPYIVGSTRGFLYLINYSISKLPMEARYIHLNSDIILNDESFDENGKPSGGDGTVYDWVPIFDRGWHCKIYGNQHTIKGMYCVQTKYSGGLFHQVTIDIVDGLNFENVYVDSVLNYTATISKYIGELSNSTIKSGYVKSSKNMIGGFCVYSVNIKNCINYADVTTLGNFAGGICNEINDGAGGSVINCKNYGDITSINQTGGIVRLATSTIIVKDCENYGDITSTERFTAGGICGYVSNGVGDAIRFYNCKNYGDLRTVDGNIGGICGVVNGYAEIVDCENYGFIGKGVHDSTGEIVGYFVRENNKKDGCLIIKNCRFVSVSGMPFVGSTQNNYNVTNYITISDCVAEYRDFKKEPTAIFIAYLGNGRHEVGINNVKVIYRGTYFNGFLIQTTQANKEVKISNIFVDIECKQMKISNLFYATNHAKKDFHFDGMVYHIKTEKDTQRRFYGNDFSGYSYTYKTGQLNLVSLDAVTGFEPRLTRDWFIDKEYNEIKL
jgi:hypothetical protein